jgi:hypothetical protein
MRAKPACPRHARVRRGRELRMVVVNRLLRRKERVCLRQAFGSYGPNAGQAWSTFVDDATFPTPSTSNRRWPSRHPAGASNLHREAWRKVVMVDRRRRQQRGDRHAEAVAGETSMDARPDHASQIRRVARARVFASAFRPRSLPPDGW